MHDYIFRSARKIFLRCNSRDAIFKNNRGVQVQPKNFYASLTTIINRFLTYVLTIVCSVYYANNMAEKKIIKKVKKAKGESSFDTPVNVNKPKKISLSRKKLVLLIGLILTLCVIVGISLYYYLQYKKSQELLKNPLLASEIEQQSVITRVGKLTQLPANEQPTIAKVSDITKLHDQSFFKNAKNGDYVLLYQKAKEVILYDPVANKVVQIGPITINQPASPSTTGSQAALGVQTTAQPIRLAIYNGTTVQGLARKTQRELQQKLSNVTIVANANAQRSDYDQTIVIDLTGKNAAVAAQIAAMLHGTVGKLPTEERTTPAAELMVILGKENN